jgi:hypothetical protein
VATISHIALPTATKDTLSESFQRRLGSMKTQAFVPEELT